MTNKDRIIHLLSDIKELESVIFEMQGAEIYPVSFFSQSFDMTHKILKDIHSLEAAQIEMLQQQMQEHQTIIQTLSNHTEVPQDHQAEQTVVETNLPIVEPDKPVETVKQPVEETTCVQAPEHNSTSEHSNLFLSDILEKKKLTDFCKAFSLNDRFRFKKDLFGGDEELMNKTLNILNNMHSYQDSINYLSNELKWNMDDNTVGDFIKLLEKKFL